MKIVSVFVAFLTLTACGQATYKNALPQPGPAGTSCTVFPTSTGALIACSDGTSTFVNNGAKGDTGADGAKGDQGNVGTPAPLNPYDIVAIIDPCGDNGAFDEILLKLQNGAFLAHYSHGSKQFLTVIGPGSYSTTDGHACNFSISNTGVVTW